MNTPSPAGIASTGPPAAGRDRRPRGSRGTVRADGGARPSVRRVSCLRRARSISPSTAGVQRGRSADTALHPFRVRAGDVARLDACSCSRQFGRGRAADAGGARSMNSGDTAWMLAATALVMIMLPGLALFYGGLVRRKNVLSTIMHSFFGLAIVSVVWVLIGFSLAFAPDVNGWGLFGGLDYVGFINAGLTPSAVYAT